MYIFYHLDISWSRLFRLHLDRTPRMAEKLKKSGTKKLHSVGVLWFVSLIFINGLGKQEVLVNWGA